MAMSARKKAKSSAVAGSIFGIPLSSIQALAGTYFQYKSQKSAAKLAAKQAQYAGGATAIPAAGFSLGGLSVATLLLLLIGGVLAVVLIKKFL